MLGRARPRPIQPTARPAALLLTQVYFPFMFGLLTAGKWPLLLLVLVRHLLLLTALLCLVFPGSAPLRWLRRPVRPALFA